MTEEFTAPQEEIKETLDDKQPKNIWKILTIILAIIFIVSYIKPFSGEISEDETKSKVEGHINALLQAQGAAVTANIESISEENNLYKLDIEIGGQVAEMYATKDGSVLFPQIIDLTTAIPPITGATTQEPQIIPKTKTPEVELYIFSYCPAGSSALDSFAPVANLLNQKVDFKVRFFSDMHGEYEKQQNIIQECIQEVNSDKYFDYAEDFLEKVYQKCAPTRDAQCDKKEATILMQEKEIDSDEVFKCVEEKGEELYTNDKTLANQFKLSSSPSLVINDVSLGSSYNRSPEGLKQAICEAFESAPEECEEALSSVGPQATGSC